jgi:diadenylate cyclase
MTPIDLRFLQPSWRDLIEIAVVAYAIYRVLLLFQGRRAVQMVTGIVLLFAIYAAAWVLKLGMITYLLQLLFTYGAFALLVIFQPELRAALARLGQSRLTRLFQRVDLGDVADEIGEAVERLSRAGVGAIIAVERETGLDEYIESGSALQARISADLLATIFTPYSPLHDGAVVVRGGQVVGAGCILPLSQTPLNDRTLGTRHRAAIGLTEETDALVIVVSEETSAISIASHGRLWRNVSVSQVRDVLAGRQPRASSEQSLVDIRG